MWGTAKTDVLETLGSVVVGTRPFGELAMTFFLVLLIGGFSIAVVVALVRGLAAFFRDAEHIRRTGHAPQEAYGVKQNRMMAQRVLFQAVAILLIVLFGSLAARN
jgi:hypothetical protein